MKVRTHQLSPAAARLGLKGAHVLEEAQCELVQHGTARPKTSPGWGRAPAAF